jgi:tetratricopeptide (TPR) repeat protein
LNPTSFDAFYGLGNAYYRARKNQEALTALKQAVKLNPDNAQAHYSIGLVFASLNDKDGVTRAFAALKRLDPKLAEQFFNAINKK